MIVYLCRGDPCGRPKGGAVSAGDRKGRPYGVCDINDHLPYHTTNFSSGKVEKWEKLW